MTDVAKDIIQEYIRKYQNISTHAYDLGWFKEMEQADEIVNVGEDYFGTRGFYKY